MKPNPAEYPPLMPGPNRAALPRWSVPFLKPARFKSASGGRGSSKSHTFAQLAVMRMGSRNPYYEPGPVRIASCRSFEVSIDQSIKQAVEHYIRVLGLSSEFDVKKYEIDHVNGSHMFFPGVTRKVDSFLSMEGLDVFWMEQAELLGDEMFKIEPTMRKPGSELWFSWNPRDRNAYCWKRFKMEPEEHDVIAHVNYDSNPWWWARCESCWKRHDYAPPWGEREYAKCGCGGKIWSGLGELDDSRKRFKRTNPGRYPHEYLGEPDDRSDRPKVLTFAMLQACMDAWPKRPQPRGAHSTSGLDVADTGADSNALCLRSGPELYHLEAWSGSKTESWTTADTGRQAAKTAVDNGVTRFMYDAIGVGSGIRDPLKQYHRQMTIIGCVSGAKVELPDTIFIAGHKPKTQSEYFANWYAHASWVLRIRADNTMRLLAGEIIDPMKCLFINPGIPGINTKLGVLQQPEFDDTGGKIRVDKKPRQPGQIEPPSPDEYDAAVFAFSSDLRRPLRRLMYHPPKLG